MICRKSITFVVAFMAVLRQSFACAFLPSQMRCYGRASRTQVYNIIDDLKLIFSEEGKKNRAAYEEREREDMIRAQQEIAERRRNPEKMEQYEAEVKARRNKLQKEKDVWGFQQKSDGSDPLEDWKRLRAEGKIQAGSDLERDEGSRRLGSEGLNDVRTDERLPYIDQGYVDEDADFMGNLMGMFGGGKKKKKE